MSYISIQNSYEQTKNSRGYQHPLSTISRLFIDFAKTIDTPVLDLGCAYGVASIEALKSGVSKVIACDIEQKHLDILQERLKDFPELEKNLEIKLGNFPSEINFDQNSLGAILASLSLPYLTIDELESGLEKMLSWLIPGGKLFIFSYTVYIKELSNPKFEAEYKTRIKNGVKWPGYLEDFNLFSTMAEENKNDNCLPKSLHFLDKEPVINALKGLGFHIEFAEYLDGKTNGAFEETLFDGREMLGVIAKKM